MRALVVGLACAMTMLLGRAESTWGQTQAPLLDRAEEYLRDGRVPEARLVVEEWWVTSRPTAHVSQLERAIWLRARVTPVAERAEFLFRRLATEFGAGPYAESARARLEMLALARSDLPLPDAESPTDPSSESSVVASLGDFAVQFGAFRNLDQTRNLADKIRAAGHEPRVVGLPGDELLRVRVGRFLDRAEAARLVAALAEAGLTGYVVGDAVAERDPQGA